MNKVLSIVFNEFKNDNRVSNQAVSLEKNEFDVTILGIRLQKETNVYEELGSVKIYRISRIFGSNFFYSIPFIRKLIKVIRFNIEFYSFIKNFDFDFVHCHDLNTLEYGFFAKVICGKRIKLVYDAHEYETECDIRRDFFYRFRKIQSIIKEKFLIRFCDRVITVSETIADEYVRLYGIERPAIILNCPILRNKEITKKDLFREYFNIISAKRIFLYQGYFYPGRGIEIVMDAFNDINNIDSVLIFMGEGPLSENISTHEKFGVSIFIHPFVSGDILLEYTSSADYGVAFLEDISLSDRYCLPNKLFEYIAAGLPVIGSGLPELKKFILENKVGVAASSNDIGGFIEAFKEISSLKSDDLRYNILLARERFNWSTQEKILIDLYKGL
uniref:glycosyltransferase n=1 Tax=Algoriphagus sp. TaxID=1872435 RepID=UPI004047BF6E